MIFIFPIQYSTTVQYSTVRFGTVQYSTVPAACVGRRAGGELPDFLLPLNFSCSADLRDSDQYAECEKTAKTGFSVSPRSRVADTCSIIPYVCMYGHTYNKSKEQPGKVANPARGQLKKQGK